MITILNTSILTTFGQFQYTALTLDEAKGLVEEGFTSAVGHSSTADILSELLEKEVKSNRIEYYQEEGESALIFKLNGRVPEGVILDRAGMEKMGYQFGLLTRVPFPAFG
jgi:hypothetical protein